MSKFFIKAIGQISVDDMRKAVSKHDHSTVDMFAQNKMTERTGGLFNTPTNITGYTDKNGRVVAPHAANHKHKIVVAPQREKVHNSSVGAMPTAHQSASRATDNQLLEQKMNGISYTFPNIPAIPAPLRGKTFTGGKIENHLIGGALTEVVMFAERVDGKTVAARVAGKPELEAQVAAIKAAEAQAKTDAQAQLEAAVPGLSAYQAAASTFGRASASYDRASERGFPQRESAALAAADAELQAVFTQYPNTALWAKIQAYQQAHNDRKSSAGSAAEKSVRAGTPIVDAVAKMEADWTAAATQSSWNS